MLGIAANCWYHHQEFIKAHLGLREKPKKPVLKEEDDFSLPDGWEQNIKKNLSAIWEKYKGASKITLPSGAQYRGETKKEKGNKIPHGKGILDDPDNFLYIGNFNNQKYEGEGQLLQSTGTKLLGNFKQDELDGYGIVTNDKGTTYQGIFKNNVPYLRGKITYPDGAFCIVNEENKENVMAHCYEKNKELYYKGDFKGYVYDGKGTLYLDNGEIYEGEFKKGKIEGYGRRLDKYGDELYRGNFVDGQFTGSWPVQNRETSIYIGIGLVNVLVSLLKKA